MYFPHEKKNAGVEVDVSSLFELRCDDDMKSDNMNKSICVGTE